QTELQRRGDLEVLQRGIAGSSRNKDRNRKDRNRREGREATNCPAPGAAEGGHVYGQMDGCGGWYPPRKRPLLIQSRSLMETGLIPARLLHLATTMALFGLALFPLYSYRSRAGELPARFNRWLTVLLPLVTLLALASALALGLLTVANMAGTLGAVADRDT